MPQAAKQLNPDLSARDKFGAELRRWRQTRGLSQAVLARLVHVSPDLVAKVEKAQRWPTARLVSRWDEVLDAGGALSELWPAVAAQRDQDAGRPYVDPELPDHWTRMLRVLAVADNAVGVHGLASVVAKEIKIIERHRGTVRGPTYIQLGRVQARWLEFASWVSDNECHPSRAAAELRQAGTLADRVGDTVLFGYVTMRRAQRALEARRPAIATALVAPLTTDTRLPARVRVLCLVRQAQAQALSGDERSAQRSLAFAYRHLDRAHHDDEDSTLAGHCTTMYVHAHEAYCRLLLGDASAAVDGYHAVLTKWPDDQRLDEGLFRAQLALANDAAGELEAADAEGLIALALARQTGSQRTLAMLAVLAERLAGEPRSPSSTQFLGAWRAARAEGAS